MADEAQDNLLCDVCSLLVQPNEGDAIDWNVFTQWVCDHPNEVADCCNCKDGRRPFLLHEVVSMNPPVHAVEALVEACPTDLIKCHRIRRLYFEATPLGVACRSGASADVIRTIIRAMLERMPAAGKRNRKEGGNSKKGESDPFAVFQEKKGVFRTTAFRGNVREFQRGEQFLSIATMKVLLEEHPDGVLERAEDVWNLRLESNESYAGRAIMWMNASDEFWEEFRLILMASSLGTVKESELNGRTFLELHAFLELACGSGRKTRDSQPTYLLCSYNRNAHIGNVMMILIWLWGRVPGQFHQRDHIGRLPIHVALSGTHFFCSSDCYREGISKVVRFLLRQCPRCASIPDNRGRLPLHLAAERGMDCVEMLAEAEPRALGTRIASEFRVRRRSTIMPLYPFQLAATGLSKLNGRPTNKEKTYSTELVFRLLRMSPMMACGLAAAKEPWMESFEYKEIQRNKRKIAQLEAKNNLLMEKLELKKKSQKRKRPDENI